MIAEIIEITGILNEKVFLVTMDIEKAFDSLDHTFAIPVLKNLVLVTILSVGFFLLFKLGFTICILNSHYEAWCYKEKEAQKDQRVQEICFKRYLLILDFRPFRS